MENLREWQTMEWTDGKSAFIHWIADHNEEAEQAQKKQADFRLTVSEYEAGSGKQIIKRSVGAWLQCAVCLYIANTVWQKSSGIIIGMRPMLIAANETKKNH